MALDEGELILAGTPLGRSAQLLFIYSAATKRLFLKMLGKV